MDSKFVFFDNYREEYSGIIVDFFSDFNGGNKVMFDIGCQMPPMPHIPEEMLDMEFRRRNLQTSEEGEEDIIVILDSGEQPVKTDGEVKFDESANGETFDELPPSDSTISGEEKEQDK